MSAVSVDEIRILAELARLELSSAEIEELRGELSAVVESMARLREVDTDGVSPMTHALPSAGRLRPDEVQPSIPAERALAAAPASRDDCFEVPAILGREPQ